MAESAVLAPFVAFAGRWWRQAGTLAAAVGVAATPAACAVVWAVPALNGGHQADGLLTGVGVVLTVIAVAALVVVVKVVARHRGVRVPGAVAVVLVAVQAAAMVLLDRLAPFRPGLLSVLLYGAPAVLLAGGVLAMTRPARVACAALAAGVFALAVPVRVLQQAVMAWEWTHAAGVPSRAWLQVINVPGMPQEPYQWDARSRALTAYFDMWIDPLYQWADVETVTSDRSAPPATLTWADGDSTGPHPVRCARQEPGLWQCAPADGTAGDTPGVGFVLRSAGVTITLTGSPYDRADLLRSIRAAHPASDAELQSRTGLTPRSLAGWLLL
jgi:hypothetical protein